MRTHPVPLPFVAYARKAAMLRGQFQEHTTMMVREAKDCLTGCSHQAYQDASLTTVRQRLFFVSVGALQGLSRPAPYHA